MITTSHGILAYWFNNYFNRKLGTKVHLLYIILGSVLPDVFHVSNAALGWLSFHFLAKHFHSELLLDISKFFHSIPAFTLIFTLAISLKILFWGRVGGYSRVIAFLWGWGFLHILVDMITHRALNWPYFWPLNDRRIPGLIDHSYPILIVIELTVSGSIFGFYLFRYLYRRFHSKNLSS